MPHISWSIDLGGLIMAVIAHIAELRKESTRHRNWLIRLSAEQGMKVEDRS